ARALPAADAVLVLHEQAHAALGRELPLLLGVLERDLLGEQVPPRDLHADEDGPEALPDVLQPLDHRFLTPRGRARGASWPGARPPSTRSARRRRRSSTPARSTCPTGTRCASAGSSATCPPPPPAPSRSAAAPSRPRT